MMTRAKDASGTTPKTTDSGNEARYRRMQRSSPDGPVSFAECQRDLLAAALDAVTNAGDLISFSRTSDGGAICLYVKHGRESFKGYATTVNELDEALTTLAEE